MGRFIKSRLIFSTEYLTRLITTLLLAIFLYVPSVSAQEKCFSLTQCVGNSDELKRAEIVPQTQLAKCEDYKAKSIAVPGLILAERKSLTAAANCSGALSVIGERLIVVTQERDTETEKRIDAENRVVFVGVVAAIAGVLLSIAGVFVVNAFD